MYDYYDLYKTKKIYYNDLYSIIKNINWIIQCSNRIMGNFQLSVMRYVTGSRDALCTLGTRTALSSPGAKSTIDLWLVLLSKLSRLWTFLSEIQMPSTAPGVRKTKQQNKCQINNLRIQFNLVKKTRENAALRQLSLSVLSSICLSVDLYLSISLSTESYLPLL